MRFHHDASSIDPGTWFDSFHMQQKAISTQYFLLWYPTLYFRRLVTISRAIKSSLPWWSQPFTSKGRQCCFEWLVVEWKQYQQVTNRWPPYLMRTVQGRNLSLTPKNVQKKKKIEIPLWMFRLKCFMLNRHSIVLSKTNMGFFVRVYPK